MNEHQVKHLEMIQAVITRMARCSFAYKGWAITIVAGIFALAAKEGDFRYFLVALVPAIAFWGLDSYYLRQERLFRKLYDWARKSSPEEWAKDPFTMNTKPYDRDVASWWCVGWSGTEAGLYGPLVLVILAVTAVVSWSR